MKSYKILSKEEVKLIENEGFYQLSDEEDAQLVFSKGFYDIVYFTDYFLEHVKTDEGKFIETPEFHEEIFDYYVNYSLDVNLIVARQHAKTTITWFYILWSLIYRPGRSFLYIAGKGLGEKTLGKIRKELETNELLISVYGNLSPKNSDDPRDTKLLRWRQRELELMNGSYVENLSSGQKVRGSRFNEVIIDDPQEDTDANTPQKAMKFVNWYYKTIEGLNKDLRTIVVGTIVSELCFVKYLRDKKGWFTVEYEGCDADFKNILWKGFWSSDRFRKKKDGEYIKNPKTGKIQYQKGMGTAIFNQEYRNIPISKEDRIIKDYWIKYHIGFNEFDKIIMSIDPATGIKERNDFTGVVVCGLIGNNVYELFSTGLKLTPNKLLRTVYNIFLKFRPDVVVKEANKETKLAEDLALKGVPLLDVWTSKDKDTRLLAISPLVESGFCYFLKKDETKEIDEDRDLVYQLTNYPEVAHDDVMDGWMICMENIQTEFEGDGTDDEVIIV